MRLSVSAHARARTHYLGCMIGRILAACGMAAALITSSAQAAVITDYAGLTSATNGIALGPDGNLWVSEYVTGNVVRMTPGGTVLGRFAVGSNPTSIATGPGNRVWVSVTGSDRLAVFDGLSANPTPTFVNTGAGCGPVAIVSGGDGRMYFSTPDDGSGCGASGLGSVLDNGTGHADVHRPRAGVRPRGHQRQAVRAGLRQ